MEQIVQQTKLLVVQPLPNHSHRGRRTDHGQEEDGTEGRGAFQPLIQEYCQQKGNGYAKGNFNQGVLDGIPQRLPDCRICKGFLIIQKAHKGIAPTKVTGFAQRLEHGIECGVEV